MPGADGAAFFDDAAGEISAGVGAVVVHDARLALVQEDGQLEWADLDVFSAAFFEFIELAEGSPRHRSAESGGMGRRTRMPVLLVQSK